MKPMSIRRNEFIPKCEEQLPAFTWETRTPVRCDYAAVTQFYKSDEKRGLFDKLDLDAKKDNIEMYYILINSWLLLCDDCHAVGFADYLVSAITKQGLLCTIAECDKRSDLVIQGLDPERAFPAFREAWSDDSIVDACKALTKNRGEEFIGLDTGSYDLTPKQAMLLVTLQLLRFPKRFSPKGLKGAREAVWNKFGAIQGRWNCIVDNEIKDIHKWATDLSIPDRTVDVDKNTRSFYNQRINVKHRFILDKIRDVVAEMLDGYKFGGYDEMVQTGDITLSPGATQDTCSCSFCKAYTVEQYTNYYGLSSYSGAIPKVGGGTIKPLTVNKNYKTYRMIAPERILTQAVCYHEARKMYVAFKKSRYARMIDLDKKWHNGVMGEGQEKSRKFAMIGSLDNSYDTIDWSSCSDSIMKHLSYYVATEEARRAIDLFACKYVDENGKVHKLNTTATSGNSLTFLWESIVVLAITIVALRLAGASEEDVMRIIVYGDDTIIPHGYAIVVRDLAQLLGLQMNPDKTCFTESFYREACGGEYYKGFDISTLYFPRNLNVSDTARASINNDTPGRTTSIIALANRFAHEEGSFPALGNHMHQFVLAVIRSWYPDLHLGGDVAGPKSPFGVRSSVTADNYHLTGVTSRKVRSYGICVSDHASLSDVGCTVVMSIATQVVVDERQWHRIPKSARLAAGFLKASGWSDETGEYSPDYLPTQWTSVKYLWCESFSTAVEAWDTPDEIRERLIAKVREAKTIANKGYTYKPLNTLLWRDILQKEPLRKKTVWNKALKPSSEFTVYNVGLSPDGYERRLTFMSRPHVVFTTERPYYATDEPATDNAVWSWRVPVTRAKSQTITRRPKPTCMCTKLTEKERREWWEMYTYQKYLSEGPDYEDALLRNLRISRRRMTYDQAYGSKKVNLVNVYEPYTIK